MNGPLPPPAATRTGKLLLVDDTHSQRARLAPLLAAACGLEVVQAENGLQALQKLQGDVFDLVLSDVEMPLLDGLKLVQCVRQGRAARPEVPILVMTSRTDLAVREKALAAGASSFLPKTTADEDVVAEVLLLLRAHG